MKKLVILVVSFLSLTVFVRMYQEYDRFFYQQMHRVHKTTDYMLNIRATDTIEEPTTYFEQFTNVLEEYDAFAFYGWHDEMNQTLSYYMSGRNDELKNFWLYEGSIEAVNKNDFYSNRSSDISNKLFKPINQLLLTVAHLSDFRQNARSFNTTINLDTNNINGTVDELVNELRQIDSRVELNSNKVSGQNWMVDTYFPSYDKTINNVLILASILIFVCLMYEVKKQGKKCHVLRTQGYSTTHIFRILFEKLVIQIIVVYAVIQISLFVFILGGHLQHTSFMVQLMLKYFILYVTLATAILILLYIQLFVQRRQDMLKGKQVNRFVSYIALATQIITVALVVQIISSHVREIETSIRYSMNRDKYLEYSENLFEVGSHKPGYLTQMNDMDPEVYYKVITEKFNYYSIRAYQINDVPNLIFNIGINKFNKAYGFDMNQSLILYPSSMRKDNASKIKSLLSQNRYISSDYELTEIDLTEPLLIPMDIFPMYLMKGDFTNVQSQAIIVTSDWGIFNPGHITYYGTAQNLQKEMDEHLTSDGLLPAYRVTSVKERLLFLETILQEDLMNALFEITLALLVLIVSNVLYTKIKMDETSKVSITMNREGYHPLVVFIYNNKVELLLLGGVILLFIILGFALEILIVVVIILLTKTLATMRHKY